MKSFLKFTLATIVGVLLSSVIAFFIFIGVITTIISSGESKEVKIENNSVLKINLANGVAERKSDNPFSNFNFSSLSSENKLGLMDILNNIKKAKTDDKIKGIYLNFTSIPSGIASVEEIRNALLDFKKSKKFIISYSDLYTLKSYYLASVSDKIYLNPEGLLDFKGLNAEIMFYKGALEKLGIEPQVIRHGKFKSAVEPFILDKMSDANREQTLKYMGSIWNYLLKGISAQRKISIDSLNFYADSLKINNAKMAVKYNFIDGTRYKDQVIDEIKELTSTNQKDNQNYISLSNYIKSNSKPKALEEIKEFKKDKIAIVYATGEIDMGKGDENKIGSEGLSRAIRKARLDSTVKAIVLRVNSPGGSALASEVIWREMYLAKKVKPVIVSMGDVAASGGYYISCPANKIYASPVTITGSIGVFGILWNGKKLLNDKLGITIDNVQTNNNAGIGSIYRPLTNYERQTIKKGVEDIYDSFLNHVAEGRNSSKDQIDSIGQGRVWSGVNAKEIGLVDNFGGLLDAINEAKSEANIKDYSIVELPKQKDIFEELMSNFTGQIKASVIKDALGVDYKYYNNIKKATQIKGIQARLPYEIEIY